MSLTPLLSEDVRMSLSEHTSTSARRRLFRISLTVAKLLSQADRRPRAHAALARPGGPV